MGVVPAVSGVLICGLPVTFAQPVFMRCHPGIESRFDRSPVTDCTCPSIFMRSKCDLASGRGRFAVSHGRSRRLAGGDLTSNTFGFLERVGTVGEGDQAAGTRASRNIRYFVDQVVFAFPVAGSVVDFNSHGSDGYGLKLLLIIRLI